MTEGEILSAPGTPCWVSLMVHDMSTTEEFYSALFGWAFREGPQELGPYRMALLHGGQVAGIGRVPSDRHSTVSWTPYMATDDADATAEQIHYCGGTVGVGPLDSDKAGRLALCSDPAGAVFGIWQPRQTVGAERHGRPGTPVWNDLLVREPTAVTKFYEQVFGYDTRREEDGGVTLLVQGRPVAAIRVADAVTMRTTGPRWVTYFETADVDASAARVTELDGQVLREPHDTPAGRMAEVMDREGATFTLVHSAR